MDRMIARLIFENWQKKLMALFGAIVIWMFVNHSIIETKTIPNIPIRIANLPEDKTIQGLLPNGILNERMTLTLSGSKDVIKELEQGDLEVLLDVSNAESDKWIVKIGRKNLISLNPSIDLAHHINEVEHSEFLIKLSDLVQAEVPVHVTVISEKVPEGFEYLDVWPKDLVQTINGPAEDVEKLKTTGLELVLDISKINPEDLVSLAQATPSTREDEVSFIVPNKWKRITIPFMEYDQEPINDPDAQFLRIDFLKKQLLPFEKRAPMRVFYPLLHLSTINPKTLPLLQNELVKEIDGINVLNFPLYARNVGSLFLDIIKDNVEIVILASPKEQRPKLHWNVEIHDPRQLEDTYVAYRISNFNESPQLVREHLADEREVLLRNRFRKYMKGFRFYTSDDQKFRLDSVLTPTHIKVTSPNLELE